MLILGVLMGMMKPGVSILVLAELAISMTLFIGAAAVLMRHRAASAISPAHTPAAREHETVNPPATEPPPDAHSESLADPEIATDGHAEVKAGSTARAEASARLDVKSMVKVDAPAEVQPMIPDANSAIPVAEVKASATAIMNKTLSEILLAALRKDPELAARIVAQAVLEEDQPDEREANAAHPARS